MCFAPRPSPLQNGVNASFWNRGNGRFPIGLGKHGENHNIRTIHSKWLSDKHSLNDQNKIESVGSQDNYQSWTNAKTILQGYRRCTDQKWMRKFYLQNSMSMVMDPKLQRFSYDITQNHVLKWIIKNWTTGITYISSILTGKTDTGHELIILLRQIWWTKASS